MIATVDVVSAKSSWNGCWLRLSYRGKGRRSQGSNFSTEMGDGSQRSLSEPRVVVVSDLCVEKRWTRARREMELGGNIGQGRQLAINALLTTQGLPGSISNEYDVTNYCNGPSYIVQTIVRGGTPNTHGNQYSVCRVTLLPRRLWAVLSNTWREIERAREREILITRESHDLHGSMMISSMGKSKESANRKQPFPDPLWKPDHSRNICHNIGWIVAKK